MKAIIFDCFGVLTADVWREFVAKLPIERQTEVTELNRAHDAGFLTTVEFSNQVTELTGSRPPTVEQSPMPVKNIELLNYISYLKQSYKIGLLSNIASDWITDSFLSPAEQNLFADMIFSHQVRLIKPDPAIFELAADRLGVEPKDCLMVDDLERICLGARQTGMTAVRYDNFIQARADIESLLNPSEN